MAAAHRPGPPPAGRAGVRRGGRAGPRAGGALAAAAWARPPPGPALGERRPAPAPRFPRPPLGSSGRRLVTMNRGAAPGRAAHREAEGRPGAAGSRSGRGGRSERGARAGGREEGGTEEGNEGEEGGGRAGGCVPAQGPASAAAAGSARQPRGERGAG